ncbi:hypothetical protein V1511DRAFT_498729 [Dipodascopsis uninucleata]
MLYLTKYNWDDVSPIPQDDGGEQPLAPIAYTEDYRVAMEYLRAIMATNECSVRALQLTEDIIMMNPAHYTVWAYRTKIVLRLKTDPKTELKWAALISRRFPKNYQIWNHRQAIVETYKLTEYELPFIEEMLEEDSKNYHVWSYRQWIVKTFNLWDGEVGYTSKMIEEDVRNNSAWNHRYFALFGNESTPLTESQIDTEISFTLNAVEKAPQNISAWNYIRGILRRTGRPLDSIEDFCLKLAPIYTNTENDTDDNEVLSGRAIEVLADIFAHRGDIENAIRAYKLLADEYDSIRENYWNYKIAQLS